MERFEMMTRDLMRDIDDYFAGIDEMHGQASYELKLADGSVVTCAGVSGVDAGLRYADAHRDVAVIAWREPPAC